MGMINTVKIVEKMDKMDNIIESFMDIQVDD